LIGRAE